MQQLFFRTINTFQVASFDLKNVLFEVLALLKQVYMFPTVQII